MKIDILTLFPQMVSSALSESVIGRAIENGIIEINCIDIRDFSDNKHRKVDDYPYGGGSGMVMQAPPIYSAYQSVVQNCEAKPLVIYLSPQGKVFNQNMAKEFSKLSHIVMLCGHYEGVDERVIEEIVDLEVSIGDYVLTGGEIPAMAVCDSICRLVPGVLPCEEAYSNDSHYNGMLEYPQYTRPPEFLGRGVPEVLLSGHHANIEKWRHEQSFIRTKAKRPDLINKNDE